MTEAQIATLERPHGCAGTLPPCECGFAEEVVPLLPRLLEERKRLLEAAKVGREGLSVAISEATWRQESMWTEKDEVVHAAIAFAEEAA